MGPNLSCLAAALCFVAVLLCPGAWAADQVSLTQSDADGPMVLVDAPYPAGADMRCDNDRPFPAPAATTPVVAIGDARAADGCDSELVVFSDGNALALIERPDLSPVNANIALTLDDRVEVPVFTWVLSSVQLDAAARTALENEFDADLLEADEIFDRSHAGISFIDDGIDFVVDPDWVPEFVAEALLVAVGEAEPDLLLQTLSEKVALKGDGINALRLPTEEIAGFHVRREDNASSGVVAVGMRMNDENPLGSTSTTLAHELGHAMSLGHVNYLGTEEFFDRGGTYCVAFGEPSFYDGECDFALSNLMWAGMKGERDYLTEGQAFRTSVNTRSFVNTNPNSSGVPLRDPGEPRRDCADWFYDERCPYLAVEVAP